MLHHMTSKRSKYGFVRLRTFQINSIFHLLGDEPYHFYVPESNEFIKTRCAGNKLRCFLKTLKCAHCSLKGNFFALERNNNGVVLNLYAYNDGMQEVLMNMDHIVPVSLGGKNDGNLQTMCYDCNQLKGNGIVPTLPKKKLVSTTPIQPGVYRATHEKKRMVESC